MTNNTATWLRSVANILESDTGDLRSLAIIGGANPATMYIGTNMDGVDIRGQDLRGMQFTDLNMDRVKYDSSTIMSDEDIPGIELSCVLFLDRRRYRNGDMFNRSLSNLLTFDDVDQFLSFFSVNTMAGFVVFSENNIEEAVYASEKIKNIGKSCVFVVMENQISGLSGHGRLNLYHQLGSLISVQRLSGFPVASSSISAEVRELIDFVSLSGHGIREISDGPKYFIRAKGSGQRRLLDAAANIFDKASLAGLAVNSSFAIEPFSLRHDNLETSIVTNMLAIRSSAIAPFAKGRYDIGVFIDSRNDLNGASYSDSVIRTLSLLGWEIGFDRDKNYIVSANDTLTFRLAFPEPQLRKSYAEYSSGDRLGASTFGDVDRVSVSPHMSLGHVAQAVAERQELLVNTRDLVGIPPNSRSLWMLVASQCKRFVASMDGRSKQQYLQILLASADRTGALENFPPLRDAAFYPGFFNSFKVSTTSYKMSSGGATFRLRLLQHGEYGVPFESPFADVDVFVGEAGVEVVDRSGLR